jgi:hypothetical protein
MYDKEHEATKEFGIIFSQKFKKKKERIKLAMISRENKT